MPRTEDVTRKWRHIDAEGRAIGRIAVEAATLLRGKHKPEFSYHVDVGDHVVVTNVDKMAITDKKAVQKTYFRHSGYPGGLSESKLGREMELRPEEVLRRAVRGMLPRNRLGRKMLKKLKIYAGPEHPHEAQFLGTPSPANSKAALRKALQVETEVEKKSRRRSKSQDEPIASDVPETIEGEETVVAVAVETVEVETVTADQAESTAGVDAEISNDSEETK